MKYTVCYVYLWKFIGVWHSTRDGKQKGSGCDSCVGKGIIMGWPNQSFIASIFAVFVGLLLQLLLINIYEYPYYCIIGNKILILNSFYLFQLLLHQEKNEISGHILQKFDWGCCQLDLHKGPARHPYKKKYYLPSKLSA